jgi:hypothetical protein
MFFYVIDVAIFNSYALQKKITEKKQHFTEFRIQLAELMIESVVLPEYPRRGRPQQSPSSVHLQALHWSHFVQFIPPNPKKRIFTVTVLCAKLKGRRVKPDTSVPSVWWRYMFQTVLGCITPQKIFK